MPLAPASASTRPFWSAVARRVSKTQYWAVFAIAARTEVGYVFAPSKACLYAPISSKSYPRTYGQ